MMSRFVGLLWVALLDIGINGQVIGPCKSLNNNTVNCREELSSKNFSILIDYNIVRNFYQDRDFIKVVCKQENNKLFRAAAICIAKSYRLCADNDFKTLIPIAENYGDAIDHVCDNVGTIDHVLNCLGDSVRDCIQNKRAREGYTSSLATIPGNRTVPFSDHQKYHCGLIKIQDECINDDVDVLACVGPGTLQVFQQLRAILLPKACGGSTITVSE